MDDTTQCLAIYQSNDEGSYNLLYHICDACFKNNFKMIDLSLDQDKNHNHNNSIINAITSTKINLKLIIADITVPPQKNEENNDNQEGIISFFGNLYYILGCAATKGIKIILIKNICDSAVGVLPEIIRKHTIIGYNSCYAKGINKLIINWMQNQNIGDLCKFSLINNSNTTVYKGKYTLNKIQYEATIEIYSDKEVIVSTLKYSRNKVCYSVLQSHNRMGLLPEDDIPNLNKGPQLSYRGVAYYNISENISEDFLLTGIVIHFNKNSISAWAQVWVKQSKDIPNNKSNIFTLKKIISDNPTERPSDNNKTDTPTPDIIF